MPTPSQTRSSRTRRPTPVVSPFETDSPEPTIEPVSAEPQEETAVAETESQTETSTENAPANKPGRKPMNPAERERRATYRACEAAAKLLRENGFEVKAPEVWENPDTDRLRESAKRALEALQAAGIDPSSLLPDANAKGAE